MDRIQQPTYLDYCATTPMDPRVIEVVSAHMRETFGNPSSRHAVGFKARAVLEESRAEIATLVGATKNDVLFTSGATEAINLMLRGWVGGAKSPVHVVASAAEHKAVLETLGELEQRNVVTVTWLNPRSDGRLDTAEVSAAMKPETQLLVAMWANNETGIINPVEELATVASARGITFVCDATQAVGKVPVDVAMGIDALLLSAHKFYGPKGVGALVANRRTRARLAPCLTGGGQESGLRSGTSNVPAIAGMSAALSIATDELPRDAAHTARLRDEFERTLFARLDGLQRNGSAFHRLPNVSNFSVRGVDGELLISNLRDVGVSAGSACNSSLPLPSHVLQAMGVPANLAFASIRVSVGRFTTDNEVKAAVDAISAAAVRLRDL